MVCVWNVSVVTRDLVEFGTTRALLKRHGLTATSNDKTNRRTSRRTPTNEKTSIMLVLTRKETQTILIGDDIVIRIVHAGGSSVKIGIEAPRGIRIVRGELLDIEGTPEPIKRDADSFSARDLVTACVGAA